MMHSLIKGLLFTLPLLVSTGAMAQEDRFGPDNPVFQEFEGQCRKDNTVVPECQGSIIGAYAEAAGTDKVACDFKAFWTVHDKKFNDKTFAVLPWQYGVQALVAEPDVCHVN
ncbi:MAG TPA: hypothetical protein VGM83_03355 [Devosiaceae bacterium]|jgi:hypothetical protein